MVFGTFDGLHPGHLNFLKQAKKKGNFLIALIARDKTVKKLKGHWPHFKEKERLEILKNLKLVDKTILGDIKDPYKVIKKMKPNVICLGYDQKFFVKGLKEQLKKANLKTKIVRLKSYLPRKYHCSQLNFVKIRDD